MHLVVGNPGRPPRLPGPSMGRQVVDVKLDGPTVDAEPILLAGELGLARRRPPVTGSSVWSIRAAAPTLSKIRRTLPYPDGLFP